MVTEIPIVILGSIFAVCISLMGLGYMYRTNFPMSFVWFLTGAIFIIIFLTTDVISLNDRIDTITSTANTLNVTSGTFNVTSYSMNVISNSANGDIDSSPIARAEKVTATSVLIGQTIDCFNIPIQIAGSPVAGNIKVGTLSSSGMIVKQFGSTIPASSFTSTFTWYEFCLPSGELYQIQSGDNLGIVCEGCLTTNGINVRLDDTDRFDGTNSVRESNIGGTWTTVPAGDMTFQLYKTITFPNNVQVAGIGGIYDYENNNYPIKVLDNGTGQYTAEPTFVGIMMLILALSFIMVGILIERSN